MSRVVFHLTALALPCVGCGDKNGDSGSEEEGSETEETFPAAGDLTAELAFEVPERPQDLAVAPDGRIFTAIWEQERLEPA